MRKTKKQEINRIFNIMESIDNNFKRRFNPDIESEFEMEAQDGEPLVFTIEAETEYGDSGIGSYEFWGERGVDKRMGYEVKDYRLKEGTYDPNYEEEIKKWIKNNSSEINEKFSEILQDRNPEDDEIDFRDEDYW